MPKDIWDQLHDQYEHKDWIDKPSIFAEAVAGFIPAAARILDLGGGEGQDSRYFADHGHQVVLTDIAQAALAAGRAKLTPSQKRRVETVMVDMRRPLPFPDASFGAVYAHLSLHYFDAAITEQIFASIYRVLRPAGILAFLVNSVTDPEFNTGVKLETDYFLVDQTKKRYFSVETAKAAASHFDPILLDSLGETYKDRAKGVHGLIRFVGRKS